MKTHVIGDSHVRGFKGNGGFKIHHLGATTMFNLCNPMSSTQSNRKFWKILNKIKPDDKLILVFGEIDCRIHIFNQHKKTNVPIEKLIDKTIQRYNWVLKFIKHEFIVCGIPPANYEENRYGYKYYGTIKQRSEINKLFNEKLKELCKDKGYSYFDIHTKYSTKEGTLKKEHTLDNVHVKNYILRTFSPSGMVLG